MALWQLETEERILSEPNQSPEINAYAPDGVKMPADHLDEGSIPDSAGGPVDSGAGQDGSGTPLSQERASETPASAMYTAGGASILKASEYDFSRAENHLLSLQQELRALFIKQRNRFHRYPSVFLSFYRAGGENAREQIGTTGQQHIK